MSPSSPPPPPTNASRHPPQDQQHFQKATATRRNLQCTISQLMRQSQQIHDAHEATIKQDTQSEVYHMQCRTSAVLSMTPSHAALEWSNSLIMQYLNKHIQNQHALFDKQFNKYLNNSLHKYQSKQERLIDQTRHENNALLLENYLLKEQIQIANERQQRDHIQNTILMKSNQELGVEVHKLETMHKECMEKIDSLEESFQRLTSHISQLENERGVRESQVRSMMKGKCCEVAKNV